MPRYNECFFNVAGLTLAAKHWVNSAHNAPNAKPRRILALHGWLDNCASFDYLAPLLNAEVVCIDLAGHGRSSARKHLGAYNLWLDIPEILAVADQLDWLTFEVLGHSRGAAIAFLLTSVFPKRIERLMCIDGIFPLTGSASEGPDQLFHSINGVKKQMARPLSAHSTYDAAVQARAKGMFPLALSDAQILAAWGVEPYLQGYRWRYDPKLNAPSELRLVPEQLAAFAAAINAPVFIALASRGTVVGSSEAMALLACYEHWQIHTLSGGHHFHMSEQHKSLAMLINSLEVPHSPFL